MLTIDGVAVTAGSIDALVALLAKVAGVCLLWSTIGLGVGMVVSHQVAAIVGSLVWLFAIENLLGALAPRLARFLPGQAGMSALGIVPGDTLDPLTGAGLLAGWAAVCLVVGAGRFQRRDIACIGVTIGDPVRAVAREVSVARLRRRATLGRYRSGRGQPRLPSRRSSDGGASQRHARS